MEKRSDKPRIAPLDSPHVESASPEIKKRRHSSDIVIDSDLSLLSSGVVETSWSPSDLCKAAQILADPEARRNFQDDEEMHRVYCLLYDVFRYKTILGHVLYDIGFFQYYPQFEECKSQVWLFLYDLYKRKFLPRETSNDMESAALLDDVNIVHIEDCLWEQRVRMAASIARLRIKNNALKLSQLLPTHLRDERMFALESAPLSGWVNTYKTNVGEIVKVIEKAGLKYNDEHTDVMDYDSYRWDHVCPNVLLCHNNRRGDFAQSQLVRSHFIVLQDRSFCIGPAVMATLLKELKLAGNVILTHINSPRSTAYFATILTANEDIGRVLAFGAGSRKAEYENYFQILGIKKITVLAEQFMNVKIDSSYFNGICAVLATPPNTYSAVLDPVDLVCSRGGDMSMLEALTDVECDDGAKKRVSAIVEQQQTTLHIAMSPPQTQIVLYETHSVASVENKDVVRQAIESMNEKMRERYVEDLLEEGQIAHDDVELPPCDMYEQQELPPFCECVDLDHEGCFLALIKRKEITRMDAKFMINIAESRGLFGTKGSKSAGSSRSHKKREEVRRVSESELNFHSRSRHKVELDRIAAPTRASILRQVSNSKIWISGDFDMECPRQKNHRKSSMNRKIRHYNVRLWWFETAKYLTSSMSESFKLTRVPLSSSESGNNREVFPLHVRSIEFDNMSQSYKSHITYYTC